MSVTSTHPQVISYHRLQFTGWRLSKLMASTITPISNASWVLQPKWLMLTRNRFTTYYCIALRYVHSLGWYYQCIQIGSQSREHPHGVSSFAYAFAAILMVGVMAFRTSYLLTLCSYHYTVRLQFKRVAAKCNISLLWFVAPLWIKCGGDN